MVRAIPVDCVWNVMAHARKPDFVFWWNGRVRLNRQRRQFGRLLTADVCASALVTLDTPCSEVVWRVLAAHSIHQFRPLHFPSRASPCAITFQLDSTISEFSVEKHVRNRIILHVTKIMFISVIKLLLHNIMTLKYVTVYYTGCNRRNGPDFGRVFLMLKYTEKPQNTYIQSWTVSEIMASEVWNFDSCYTLTDYQIHIETGRNMWFL